MSARAETAASPRAGLREPLAAFLAATAIASALYWTARSVSLVQELLHGAIAVLFLLGPSFAARLSGRPFDQRAAGLTLEPVALNLRVLVLALLVTWPLFFTGFLLLYGFVCPAGAPAWAHRLSELLAFACPHWQGLAGARLRLPDGLLTLALAQLIVVSIPEEFFFRGYLMGRFEDRWPSRRRLWGAPVGLPLIVSSLLFGLGHFLVDFQPARLAVVFPALAFGWMRARTGSLAPAAVFHALCNVLSEVLHASFFG
jgi:hypothetical protein